MKSKILLSIFLSAIALTAFSQVTSDFDKNADFTKYKTYSFKGWVEDSDKQIPDFDKKRIADAFKAEFALRGMEIVESGGDVDVTLFIVVDKKTSTTAYTNYNGGYGYGGYYGGGRMGWGGGMGMGSSTTTYSEDDYLEGTTVIDFYDASTKNLIYQGVIRTTVKEKPAKREKSIPKNVKKLMYEYPVKPMKKKK